VIEPSQHDVIIYARRIELHNLFVLLDGQLEHAVGAAAALHVAE
jgi:hypothetical protein